MNLPMRITFENSDYIYSILSKNVNGGILEVKISFGEKDHILVRTMDKQWNCPSPADGYNLDLLKAIGKSIALRYRL